MPSTRDELQQFAAGVQLPVERSAVGYQPVQLIAGCVPLSVVASVPIAAW